MRHKGFYEDAIEEFAQCLEIRDPLLGPWHIDTGKTNYSLGLAKRAIRDYRDALTYLTKACQAFEGQKDENRDEELIRACKLNIARTHHSQGVDFQRQGDYDRSIVEHRKSMAIREAYLGKDHLETARTYYVMGCALSDRGDFEEALGDLRKCLRVRKLVFGKDHLDTIEVMDNMMTVCHAKGNMDTEQVEDYRSCLLDSIELELEGDWLSTPSETEAPDYEEAIVCYRRALGMEESCLGELHPTTCELYLKMADAFGKAGDLEAALQEYKAAISIYENLLGKFHIKVAQVYSNLGKMLLEKGEYETALSFFCKAYGIFDSTLGNHQDTIQMLNYVRAAAQKEATAKKSLDMLNLSDSGVTDAVQDLINEVDSKQKGGDEEKTDKNQPKKKNRKQETLESPRPTKPKPIVVESPKPDIDLMADVI